MKKTKKLNTVKKTATSRVAMERIDATPVEKKKTTFNPWSLSIYVYWFIILFFIAATFYIIGRSHNLIRVGNNVEVTEEALLQSADYYESGKTKLLAGNIEEAIVDLSASIDTGGASIETYILRGEAYMQSGNYASAMADFDSAIARDAENAIAYYDRSLLNMRLENYSAALDDINNALALSASNPDTILQQRDLYAKRGQLNLWMKNWDGAIADYTNSLARPDGVVNPSVYAERAEAYTAVGRNADAINDYASAVRVISEQIQGATTREERETLSSNAMNYFEKSAALNLNLGNVDAAVSDLQSARTIGAALNDADTVARLDSLISELVPAPAPAEPTPEPVVEPAPAPVESVVEQ